ncbi:MAG: alkaline phosphatase [Chromatiaceae bacterium]|jgi:alkaline phosphatase
MKARVLTLALSGLLALAIAPCAMAKGPLGLAKNVILFIGDGMNIEHEIATSRYLYGMDFGLTFHQLPYQGNVATWDVNTYNNWSPDAYDPDAINPLYGYDPSRGGELPYPLGPELEDAQAYHTAAATDSASAATAWATGYKTDAGNIAWLPGDPEDGALETIAELLREELGYAIGVVSTVPFTHATPAAHVSHNVYRNNYHEIADEILTKVKPEVVIGGGYPGPTGTDGFSYLSENTYNEVKDDDDYVMVERQDGVDGGVSVLEAAQVAAAEGKKLFGLYGGPGGNFESPIPHDLPGTPLITRATMENPLFKDAVLAALKVLGEDEDGLFLMAEQGDIDWANHANDFSRMVGTTWDLNEAVQSVIDYVNRPGDDMDWDNTLLLVTSDHSNSYMRLVVGKELGAGDLPLQEGSTYPDGEVTYGSGSHTNELVRIYGDGAGDTGLLTRAEGVWYPGTTIIDNTQLYHVMTDAAGLPQASPLTLDLKRPRHCGPRREHKSDR